MKLAAALSLGAILLAQDAPANPVDAYFKTSWTEAGVSPAAPAGDAELLRRLTLDLWGRLPAPEEIRAFVADKSPDKRAKLIDRQLRSEEFGEFFADLWLDILVDHDVTQQDFARSDLGPFRLWLK